MSTAGAQEDGEASGDESRRPSAQYDHVVLGAGVAGLTAARLLVDRGARTVLVLDEYPQPGGSQRSYDIHGYTFDIGAFYFWDAMPFFQLFPEVRATCARARVAIERVTPQRTISRYPLSIRAEVFARGPRYWLAVAASLARARLQTQRLASAEAYTCHLMGERLYRDLGMAAYIERFHDLPPAQIEAQFAISRMEIVRKLASLRYWAGVLRDRARQTLRGRIAGDRRALLVRPESGFPSMYAPAVAALRARGVELRFAVGLHAVSHVEGHFSVHTASEDIRATSLVSTIPIRRLAELLHLQEEVEKLQSSSLLTLFVSFAGRRGFDAAILYNFGPLGRWKRLTMHSTYYGPRQGREYFSVEIPFLSGQIPSASDLFGDFRSAASAYGLFDGDLQLEGHVVSPDVYPAFVQGTSARLAKVQAALERIGVNTVGRQGRFDYLPTGAHVVRQVNAHLRA